MPFALIPEGFKLQKVSKLQQEAVDKYYSNKSTTAFLEGDSSGEVAKALTVVVTPILVGALAKYVIDNPDQFPNLDENALTRLRGLALTSNPFTAPIELVLKTLDIFD